MTTQNQQRKPLDILITNDDGILAPGLAALIRAAEHLGNLHVVAPETAQSAAAHSITLTEPLISQHVELPGGIGGFSISGRPADCVKLAMTELLPTRPDLVISGINAGANVGVNVLYSGTVAAALEAAFFNVPGIAISLDIRGKIDFKYAEQVAREALDQLVHQSVLTPGRVLNVNIPIPEIGPPKGMRVVRQSTRAWADRFQRRTDPRGRVYFWLDADVNEDEALQEETDEHAINEGYITVTPLNRDLTDLSDLRNVRELLGG